MSFKPFFGRVSLERDKLKTVAILVPVNAEKRNAPTWGTVVGLGETADKSIRIGQKVAFGVHAGTWLKLPDGSEVFVCQDEDLLGEWA